MGRGRECIVDKFTTSRHAGFPHNSPSPFTVWFRLYHIACSTVRESLSIPGTNPIPEPRLFGFYSSTLTRNRMRYDVGNNPVTRATRAGAAFAYFRQVVWGRCRNPFSRIGRIKFNSDRAFSSTILSKNEIVCVKTSSTPTTFYNVRLPAHSRTVHVRIWIVWALSDFSFCIGGAAGCVRSDALNAKRHKFKMTVSPNLLRGIMPKRNVMTKFAEIPGGRKSSVQKRV